MDAKQKTLRDWLPSEFFSEYMGTPAADLLSASVTHEIRGSFRGADLPWPGKHKNINVWCLLETGHAVGWNENPSTGWSFPVIKVSENVVRAVKELSD